MKKSKWLLWGLLALLLTGCSLARAEAPEESGDRWVGFYVAPCRGGRNAFYSNPYLEEYGSLEAETDGFGTLTFPREVLFAVEDEAGNYTFPGMEEGYSLFYLEKEEAFGHVNQVVSNMGPHDNGTALSYKDEGSSITISGTVYCGPPQGVTDWDPYTNGTIWHFYKVYQTEDERVYINGDGDSTNGPMAHTSTETRTSRENGETIRKETLSVTAVIEAVSRMERLVVTQFDGSNAILRSDDLALREKLPEIICEPEAAWVLVEEIGMDEIKRTVYNVPEKGEEPVSHMAVLLDDRGLGQLAYLSVQRRSD